MGTKAIKSIKEAFESDNAIITNIMQGLNGVVRVDAKTRFYEPDRNNRLSIWCTRAYANKLSRENHGKNIDELNVYSY